MNRLNHRDLIERSTPGLQSNISKIRWLRSELPRRVSGVSALLFVASAALPVAVFIRRPSHTKPDP
jgi:hypothetical protein